MLSGYNVEWQIFLQHSDAYPMLRAFLGSWVCVGADAFAWKEKVSNLACQPGLSCNSQLLSSVSSHHQGGKVEKDVEDQTWMSREELLPGASSKRQGVISSPVQNHLLLKLSGPELLHSFQAQQTMLNPPTSSSSGWFRAPQTGKEHQKKNGYSDWWS